MRKIFALFFLSLALVSCSKEDTPAPVLSVFSMRLNGANLNDGQQNVPVGAAVEIVFSAAISPADFEAAFSLTPAQAVKTTQFAYANQSSKVTITLELEYETAFTLRIGDGPIGQNGERLEAPWVRSFTTMEDGTIYALPPCTSGDAGCLEHVALKGDGTADFYFYSSFPIYEELAEWRNLKAALIVVHGASRNPDAYFNYVMTTLQAMGLEEEVVLIAPSFRIASEAAEDEYYWSSNNWREGQRSAGDARISSFAAVDSLVARLADPTHFPVLEKVLITGQSSGALFTHLYAGANRVEEAYPELDFSYLVSESQYFYYPDGRRIDEQSGQLYVPSGCAGYDIWPLGFRAAPSYLQGMELQAFNDRLLHRSVTYILGNGSGSDPALNTTDCGAVLLGSSRYQRGENIYRYLELAYPGMHAHGKAIVPGVAHNGSAIYQSMVFRGLVDELLND